MVNNWLQTLLRPGWPRLQNCLPNDRCLVCQRAAESCGKLCPACNNLLENQSLKLSACCASCALPLPAASSPGFNAQCGECLLHSPPFERCIAAVAYGSVAARLVNNLKHHQQLAAISPIGTAMLRALHDRPIDRLQYLFPVPLHRQRLGQRGFNQSLAIAQMLGRALDLPVARHLCERVHADPPQQQLDRGARQRNLRGAFVFRRSLSGARVAIVDDVVTTTATAHSMAEAALAAGALNVEIWCFARTPAPA